MADVNGLRLWPVMDRTALGFAAEGALAPHDVAWDGPGPAMGGEGCGGLRLARRQAAPVVSEDLVFARSEATRPSPLRDAAGAFAWWDATAQAVLGGGLRPGSAPLVLPPEDPPGVPRPDDLAFGADDVLYAARNGAVTMTDRRERWPDARISLPGFAVRKLAPAPGGGCWALDRAAGRIARLKGRPLRVGGARPELPEEHFEKVEPNPDPPRLILLPQAVLPAGREAVCIAASPGGRLALVAWRVSGGAEVYELEEGRLVFRFETEGLRAPYSAAWIGETALALMASDGAAPAAQAYVYEPDAALSGPRTARPMGAVHRLLEAWPGGFCNFLAARPSYLAAEAGADAPQTARVLRPLSLALYAPRGETRPQVLDSGEDGFVWHRLRFDAEAPEGTGAVLWAWASDDPEPPEAPGAEGAPAWAPHVLGGIDAGPETAGAARVSRLDPQSSPEHHEGLLEHGAPRMVLLQRPGVRVRRLSGRFLHLHLDLRGDARGTPRIAGLRAYGGRFSYRDRYLPAMFAETLAGAEALAEGAATPPDFLERLLALFEGPFTEIEDRIAGAWLLTDPHSAPEPALPWLAAWIGVETEPAEPAARLREKLKAAPHTARLHGSAGGVLAALELATGGVVATGAALDPYGEPPRPGTMALARDGDAAFRVLTLGLPDAFGGGETAFAAGGAVTGGEIVMVEGFRLRRSFATILGADLTDRDNPLTLGGEPSGNSIVGDTLILGDERARALMNALVSRTPRGRAAVEAFLDLLAHRALLLVREDATTKDLARIEETARAAGPAHADIQVIRADRPLRVAVSSLVGIDTYLTPAPAPRTARLNRSILAHGDLVGGSGSLDPRADGPAQQPPVAEISGPALVMRGTDFVLSGERSRAFGGREIVRNIFMWT